MLHFILLIVQRSISICGILIILSGIIVAIFQYVRYVAAGHMAEHGAVVNSIRLSMCQILILGLEFIVVGDLIGTITAPDYYTAGLLAIIVAIRTLLSFSINREIQELSRKNN